MIFRRLVGVDDFRCFASWRDDETVRPHRFGKITAAYGANGSGKSTIADIFAAVQRSQRDDGEVDEWLAGVRFELVDEDGSTATRKGTEELPRVVVFNKRYQQLNLGRAFDGGHGAALYVLGEPDVELEENIEKASGKLEEAKKTEDAAKRDVRKQEEAVKEVLEQIKADVVELLQTFDPNRYNRTKFNVTKARTLVEGIGRQLEPVDLDAARGDLHLSAKNIPDDATPVHPPSLDGLQRALTKLAEFEVVSQSIERLQQDQRLADWAQHGLALHDEGDRCGFCDNVVSGRRMADLQAHFNDSYRRLLELTRDAEDELKRYREALGTLPESTKRLVERGDKASMAVEGCKARLQAFLGAAASWVTRAEELIERRRAEPFATAAWNSPDRPAEGVWDDLKQEVDAVNRELDQRRRNIEETRRAAERRILAHISAKHTASYNTTVSNEKEAATRLKSAQDDVGSNAEALRGLRAQKRSDKDGQELAASLTKDLRAYLGHGQISVRFDSGDDGTGFRFLRNGRTAKDLSEGECNAIALLHFLTSLDSMDHREELPNSVVVIDDPVSSLDQDAILSAYSFLLTRLRPGGNLAPKQLVVLTHNHHFLRLWRNSVSSALGKDARKAKERKSDIADLPHRRASLLELRTRTTLEGATVHRSPVLREFDPKLHQLTSEYYFLFVRAAESTRPDGEHLLGLTGNSTRRLLESFVSFKCPASTDLTGGASVLAKSSGVDAMVVARVVKSLHVSSHRDQPDLHSQQHITKVVDDIRAALRFIRTVDPKHYEGMCKATGAEPDLQDGSVAASSG